MSEEKKEEEEKKVVAADPEPEKAETVETSDKEEPDYKALLEAEKAKTAQLAEEKRKISGALKEARTAAKAKKEPEPEPEEEEEEEEQPQKPDISSAVREALREERVKEALQKRVTNPEKRALVQHYLQTRITPSGSDPESVNDDIDLAMLAVDKSAFQAEASRKAKKELAEKAAFTSSGGRLKSAPEEAGEEPTKEEIAIAQSVGMDPKKFKELNAKASLIRS